MYAGQFRFFLSTHIYKVVDAMTHAVTSTRPKLRYGVGWDHKFFWRPLSLLPSEILTKFNSSFYASTQRSSVNHT